jgi:hypothetical protein
VRFDLLLGTKGTKGHFVANSYLDLQGTPYGDKTVTPLFQVSPVCHLRCPLFVTYGVTI